MTLLNKIPGATTEEQTQNGKIGKAGDKSCPSTISSCLQLDSFTTLDALDFSREEK